MIDWHTLAILGAFSTVVFAVLWMGAEQSVRFWRRMYYRTLDDERTPVLHVPADVTAESER